MGGDDFDAFVRASTPALLRTATLLSGDVELGRDLLQAALVKTLLRWPSVEHPAAYVRRAMVTTVIDWRRRRRFTEVPLYVDRGMPDASGALVDREVALRLLRSLPPAQRAVLVLRFYEDLSERATADALGISVGAVKSQTSRALAALRLRAVEEVEG